MTKLKPGETPKIRELHNKFGRKPAESKSSKFIRESKYCNRQCPAFELCPIMPLAIQPLDPKNRLCLVKSGPEEIQRAYKNLFSGGHAGIVEEMQRGIIEYGEILRKDGKSMKPGQRLQHIAKLNSMLAGLDKMLMAQGGSGQEGIDDVTIVTGEEPEEEDGEDQLPEDPESLAYSEKLEEIFPSKKPVNPEEPCSP